MGQGNNRTASFMCWLVVDIVMSCMRVSLVLFETSPFLLTSNYDLLSKIVVLVNE